MFFKALLNVICKSRASKELLFYLLVFINNYEKKTAPMAANTVFSTPDDGRRKRPKHVE
jgi:hypothetical protein